MLLFLLFEIILSPPFQNYLFEGIGLVLNQWRREKIVLKRRRSKRQLRVWHSVAPCDWGSWTGGHEQKHSMSNCLLLGLKSLESCLLCDAICSRIILKSVLDILSMWKFRMRVYILGNRNPMGWLLGISLQYLYFMLPDNVSSKRCPSGVRPRPTGSR